MDRHFSIVRTLICSSNLAGYFLDIVNQVSALNSIAMARSLSLHRGVRNP